MIFQENSKKFWFIFNENTLKELKYQPNVIKKLLITNDLIEDAKCFLNYSLDDDKFEN